MSIGLFFLFSVWLGLYLLPTLIAFIRNAPNKLAIVVVNIVGGWTGIVWIICLGMALMDRRPT